MKKFLASLFALFLMLNLQACGSEEVVDPNTQVLSSVDCQCTMRFPDSWVESSEFEKAAMEISSPDGIQQVLVFHADIPEGQNADFDQYVNYTVQQVEESSKDFKNLSRRELRLGGMKAVQFELETLTENVPITNLLTIVEGEGKFYQILAWSTTSNYKNVFQGLLKIIDSFKQTPAS